MNTEAGSVDVQRQRWMRARQVVDMVDVESESFAMGGLARYVDGPSVRILILPADPEAVIIADFDDALSSCQILWKFL